MRKLRYHLLVICVFVITVLMAQTAFCQVKIHGTVFDITKKHPLEGVSVLSNKNGGTSTDIHGRYLILITADDSIYFSYQGKTTMKYAVRTLIAANNFDISIPIKSDVLPEVFVRPRSYKEDSLQNRLDYAKVFNYRKPRLGISSIDPSSGQGSVGVDLDQLIDIFRIRKKKDMLAFQRRVEYDEQEKYIDFKFNKALVKKLTGLEGAQLDTFMKLNRPTYLFAMHANDYDFGEYIRERAENFKAVFLRKEETNLKTP